MEKGVKVSDGGSVYYLNVTVNIDKTEETKYSQKAQRGRLTAAKTGAMSENDDFAENVDIGIVRDENSPQNASPNYALKQRFEKHIGNPDYFQMTKNPKGKVLIINNTFRNNPDQYTRKGSEVDVKSLENAFELLSGSNSSVSIIKVSELSASAMLEQLEFCAASKTRPSFLAVIIMSHGGSKQRDDGGYDDLITCNDVRVNAQDVVDIFKKEHLKDIPVLLFFQMCRGIKNGAAIDLGVRTGDCTDEDDLCKTTSRNFRDLLRDILPGGKFVGDESSDQGDTIDAHCFPFGDTTDQGTLSYVENVPNMLISFSTSEKFVSLRNETNGSWFIQALCDDIKKKVALFEDIDILDLMKEVHSVVHGRRSEVYKGLVIACETAQSLGVKKKLCFFPGCP